MKTITLLIAGLLAGLVLTRLFPIVDAQAQSNSVGIYQMYIPGESAGGVFVLNTQTGAVRFCDRAIRINESKCYPVPPSQ